MNKFYNLSLNLKNTIILSLVVLIFLTYNIITTINFTNKSLEEKEKLLAYSILQSSISSMKKTFQSQESLESTLLNRREFEKTIHDFTKANEQKIKNTALYKSSPFVIGEDVGNDSANNKNIKVIFQSANPQFDSNKLSKFSQESLKNLTKDNIFTFSIDKDNGIVKAFYGVLVSKNMLSEYGDISQDIDGNGYNSMGMKMPGWKVGDIKSGYYLESNISDSLAASNTQLMTSIFIQILIGLLSILLFGTILKKSTQYSTNKIKDGINEFFKFLNRETNHVKAIDVKTDDDLGEIAKLVNNGVEKISKETQQDLGVMGEIFSFSDNMAEGKFDSRIYLRSSNPRMNYFIDALNNLGSILQENAANILNVMEEYSKHNYTSKVNTDGLEASLLRMATSVNSVGKSVSEMLEQNSNDGNSLSNISTNLLENVNILNQNSKIAASKLEETSAALDEITKNISTNSSKITEMSNYATELTTVAKDGQKLASKTTQSMDEIDTQVNSISEAIAVIDQIAFQTNILSLNAAVEAATAGEAGKGFAVVAQEVRNLANRSADAANDIKALVESATDKTNLGKKVSEDMILGYSSLNEFISKTMLAIKEVEESSKKQQVAIEQINDAVNQLDEQTQQNSQIASQTNDVAKQTDKIAKAIVQTVEEKQFKK